MVQLLEVGKHFDECRPIVGDNLTKSTPLAQDVFEDPISDGLCSFCTEGMVFGEMCKGTVAFYKVIEATSLREVHGVHAHFSN